jgi:hypothetical protein
LKEGTVASPNNRERFATNFMPSKGPVGELMETPEDGKVYCRSVFGIREVDPAVGPSMLLYQRQLRKVLRVFVKRRVLLAAIAFKVGTILGVILGSKLF